MSFCDSLILQDIVTPCSDTLKVGFEHEGVLINRDDIEFESCEVEGNIIKSIELAPDAVGYKITQPSNDPFTGTQTTIESSTYYNSFTNNVQFVILDNSPEVCQKVINGLANGSFVVILENKTKGNGQEFQVYGWQQGTKTTELSCEKYNNDTEGGWLVTLEESSATNSSMYFNAGDYDTTKAAVESLVSTETSGVLYGYIPSYISGFSTTDAALLSAITEDMVKSAKSAGTIRSARTLPITEDNAKLVTTIGKFAYFIALIPDTMEYEVKQWNGLTEYEAFDGDAGYYANGDVTLKVGDTTYKVFAQFALANGMEFKITIQ